MWASDLPKTDAHVDSNNRRLGCELALNNLEDARKDSASTQTYEHVRATRQRVQSCATDVDEIDEGRSRFSGGDIRDGRLRYERACWSGRPRAPYRRTWRGDECPRRDWHECR